MSKIIHGLQLTHSEVNGILKISLKGQIDSLNADSISDELSKCISGKKNIKIALDCSALNYISSTGLRVFIMFGKNITQIQSSLVLFFEENTNIHKLFSISGLDNVFKMTTHETEAYKLLEN